MFDYPCNVCGDGDVLEKRGPYKTKLHGHEVTIDDAVIGECNVCGAKHFDPEETKRWRKLVTEKTEEKTPPYLERKTFEPYGMVISTEDLLQKYSEQIAFMSQALDTEQILPGEDPVRATAEGIATAINRSPNPKVHEKVRNKPIEEWSYHQLAKILLTPGMHSWEAFSSECRRVFAGQSYEKNPRLLLRLGGLPWRVPFELKPLVRKPPKLGTQKSRLGLIVEGPDEGVDRGVYHKIDSLERELAEVKALLKSHFHAPDGRVMLIREASEVFK